jgi:methanogenic corrinoid protein MtbC1
MTMTMNHQALLERFFETLVTGDRPAARTVVAKAKEAGLDGESMILELFWPTHQSLEKLRRADQISTMSHHMATRLLRVLIDQCAAGMQVGPSRNKRVLAFCGGSEQEELAAQMAVDVLEANGFTVCFAGSGIANDEILARVNENKPDVLLMFASAPTDLPNIRALIDTVREIGACPNMQFAVGGGVFNRADGLAEEIGSDLWAKDPVEMAQVLIDEPGRKADAAQRTVGKPRTKAAKKAA